jgi:hypothetical protein
MKSIWPALAFIALALCSGAGCDKLAAWRGAAAPGPNKLLALGQRAADAEEMHLHHAPGGESRFTDRLEDLLPFDRTLADDPAVTFEFGPADGGNYRLTIRRTGQRGSVVCDAETGCHAVE